MIFCLLFLSSVLSILIQDNVSEYNVNLNPKKVLKISNITIPQEIYDLEGDFSLKISDLFFTRIPGCLLKKARYQYTINLLMENNGIIKGDLSVPAADCLKELRPRSGKYKITIKSSFKEIGKRPLLREWREKEEVISNQSFFGRYWYIIVPVMLFLFVPLPGEKES
jgi:hypothetical protein